VAFIAGTLLYARLSKMQTAVLPDPQADPQSADYKRRARRIGPARACAEQHLFLRNCG
jgi:hypothetical protein